MDQSEIRIVGSGVVLREWTASDLSSMVGILMTPRWPTALRSRHRSTWKRQVLTSGEMLLNLAMGTIGYTVGAKFRGQGLARRAADLMTSYAHRVVGMDQVRAEIEPDNHASIAVAEGIGYRLTSDEPGEVEDGRRSYSLRTWIHEVPASAGES